MKSSIFIFIHLLAISFVNFSFSQEIEWQNTIGGTGTDRLNSIEQTLDRGYILGGYSNSGVSGDKNELCKGAYDYWILKTDSNGNVIWQNTIGGSLDDKLISIHQTVDSGYIVGGISKSNVSWDKTAYCKGEYDYWIVKTNSVGVITWQKTIGGNNDDILSSIEQTNDGGFILSGHSVSNISGDKSENCKGGSDYWIVKTSSFGVIQWQKTIGGSGYEFAHKICQSADGGYLVSGYSNSNISGDKTENSNGGSDFWLVKFDSLGNILWQNTIGGNNEDYLTSIVQTKDSGFIIGGSSHSSTGGDKLENNIGDFDYWILKTDSIGNIQWQNTIGGTLRDDLESVIQTFDNGFLAGGYSYSYISGDKTETRNGNADYWLIRMDSLGKLIWQNTIGGDGFDGLFALQQTNDKGYILGGHSDSNLSVDKSESRIGLEDFWIVKLTDQFNSITGKLFIDTDLNGEQDFNEPPLSYGKLKEPLTQRICYSKSNGEYKLILTDTGNFSVDPRLINFYTATPAVHNVSFSSFYETDSLNNFAFQPAGIFNDLCVDITPMGAFRSGRNAYYIIDYINKGTTTLSPTVVFYPDSNLVFLYSSPTPSMITSDSIVYSFGPLSPFQSGQITISVSVDQGLPIGTLVFSRTLILPVVGDDNPVCNQSNWEVYTVGSWDPNDILVNRGSISDIEIPSSPDLEYIIRFQNTGNDTAFYIRIDNEISEDLLVNEIEFVSSSHLCDIEYQNYESTLKFTFPNILLPDSNVNEPQSHGFVRYKIKPNSALLAGDSITNSARITFDYNTPVVTNNAVTQITAALGLNDFNSNTISIYPNPFSSEFTIDCRGIGGVAKIELFDLIGQKIRTLYSGKITNDNWNQTYDMNSLASGFYIVQILGDLKMTTKIVKF